MSQRTNTHKKPNLSMRLHIKPIGICSLFASAFLSLDVALPAQASLIAYDAFDYTAGATLGGRNGGTGWSGAYGSVPTAASVSTFAPSSQLSYTSGSIAVAGGSGSVRITGNTSPGGLRPFASQTGTVYASLLFRPGSTPTNDDFISFFLTGATNSLNSNAQPSLQFGDLNVSDDYFGVRASNSSADTTQNITGSFATGTTYFLVAEFSKVSSSNYDTIKLWVNPTDTTTPLTTPSATATRDTGLASLGRFGIRTVNIGSGETHEFDELRIGTTWQSVVPIPEPATIATLLVVSSSLLLRRRAIA
jgi:hypothetical protein